MEEPALEELLLEHPTIGVERQRAGYVTVWEDLPDGSTRIINVFATLGRGVKPHIFISSVQRWLPRNKWVALAHPTYVTLYPRGKFAATARVHCIEPGLDTDELFSTIRIGFRILDALLKTPHWERAYYNRRAHDCSAGHDLATDVKGSGTERALAQMGVDPDDINIDRELQYMKEMLSREIAVEGEST